MTKTGYTIVDPGRYQEGSEDFTAEISLFKKEGCELVAGTMSPPDMITFLNQASQQGLAPVIATIERASLFPSVMGSYRLHRVRHNQRVLVAPDLSLRVFTHP